MNESQTSLIRNAYVPIEAAAELVNVEISTIRGWVASGSLFVEHRGDMEVVQLGQVRALASRATTAKHGVLRDRLKQAGGTASGTDLLIITDLQDLVRNRVDLPESSGDLVLMSAPRRGGASARNGSGLPGGLATARLEGRLPLILH